MQQQTPHPPVQHCVLQNTTHQPAGSKPSALLLVVKGYHLSGSRWQGMMITSAITNPPPQLEVRASQHSFGAVAAANTLSVGHLLLHPYLYPGGLKACTSTHRRQLLLQFLCMRLCWQAPNKQDAAGCSSVWQQLVGGCRPG